MFIFGTLAYVIAIGIFIYFVSQNYASNIGAAFISVDPNAGQCSTVPISISGTFEADEQGNWVGQPAFYYSKSVYQLDMNNFEATNVNTYPTMMTSFRTALDEIGRIASVNNLEQNLISWMSYIRYYSVANPDATNFNAIGYGQLQYIQLIGSPLAVFSTDYIQASFASAAGNCPLESLATFDDATGLMSIEYNVTQFDASSVCFSAAYPATLGYYQPIEHQSFSIDVEVRAFSTAVAVNLGIISISDLRQASSEVINFDIYGVNYTGGSFFDVRYYEMNPVFCIFNNSLIPTYLHFASQLCFYELGQTFALPVFNSLGANYSQPEYCNCSTSVGKLDVCDQFNLMASLLFFRSSTVNSIGTSITQGVYNSGITKLLSLISRYDTYTDFAAAAYPAAFSVAAPAFGSLKPYYTTTQWYQKAFSFCSVQGTTCSLLVFNIYNKQSKTISPYKYQLQNGSCHDTISPSSSTWDSLVNNPPATLTQAYYECYPTSINALLNAFGISIGNTQLAIPIACFAMLPFLYLVLMSLGQMPPKKEYNNKEKRMVEDTLALILLRLRDGKTRGIKPDGVLMQLTKELISAAKEEGGYPDSDDEDDDDDDEDPELDDEAKLEMDPNSAKSKRKSRKLLRFASDNQDTPLETPRSNPRRRKLAVFTKHIEEREKEPRPSSVIPRPDFPLPPLISLIVKRTSRKATEPLDPSSIDPNQHPTDESYTSYFSSFFSSHPHHPSIHPSSGLSADNDGAIELGGLHDETATTRTQHRPPERESVTFNPLSPYKRLAPPMDLLSLHDVPSEIQVMNLTRLDILSILNVPVGHRMLSDVLISESNKSPSIAKPSGKDSEYYPNIDSLPYITSDLVKLLGETMEYVNNIKTHQKYSASPTVSKTAAMHGDSDDEEEESGVRLPTGLQTSMKSQVVSRDVIVAFLRECLPYQQAKTLAKKLHRFNLTDLLQLDEKESVLINLSNALCMHGSIELEDAESMNDVAKRYDKSIAYSVGGKLLTPSYLVSLVSYHQYVG